MSTRALFLADGSSDLPLGALLATLCCRAGLTVDVVPVPSDRLPRGAARTVSGRLSAVFGDDPDFACVFVHRDAENEPSEHRHDEVRTAITEVSFAGPAIAVVPVRMTEAWLLLDERAIRRVAGKPSGRAALGLPAPRHAEGTADPKTVLQQALITAAEVRGRRLKTFRGQFGNHRRQLLSLLDPDGPVACLPAWQRLRRDIDDLVRTLRARNG